MKTNLVNYFNTAKKIQAVKTNTNKASQNLLAVTCKLSRERLSSSQAICLNIKANNTAYISKKYLSHNIFENIQITENFKIDILTLVYLGAVIKNTKNNVILSTANYNFDIQKANYIITLKNDLQVIIFDNDAKSKKYFNILKQYKKSISNIKYQIQTASKLYCVDLQNIDVYPCFAKKLSEYKLGISYNPNSKKDCIQTW